MYSRAGPGNAGPCRAGQEQVEKGRIGQGRSRAGPGNAGPCRAGQERVEKGRIGQVRF